MSWAGIALDAMALLARLDLLEQKLDRLAVMRPVRQTKAGHP